MTVQQSPRAAIVETIASRRDAGKVTCGFRENVEGAEPTALADAIALSHGFTPPGAAWYAIERPEALRILSRILSRDLAYDAQIMSEREADDLATAFLSMLPDAHSYFTNGSWGQPKTIVNDTVTRGDSWNPISTATFDAGVIVVGLTESALLWIEDED